MKTRIIARHQQVVRVDREQRAPLPAAIEESLIRSIKSEPAACSMRWWSPTTTRAWLPKHSPTACLTNAAASGGVLALVNPKTSRLFAYRGATAIVCNAKQAGFCVTRELADDDESIEQAGRALLAHFGCAAVVITRGSKGMNLFEDKAPARYHVP